MKIAELDTKASANHGAWLHVKHPLTGEPIVDAQGNPARVKVHGMECDAVKRARIRRDRANMGHDVDTYITQEEHGDNVLEALIIDFEGFLDDNDEPLQATPEGKRRFLNLSENIRRQILSFSLVHTNFLEPPATG